MIQSTSLEKVITVPQDRTLNAGIGQRSNLVKPTKDEVYMKDETNIINESQHPENSFTPQRIIKAIEETNKNLEPTGRKLEYSIHERTNRILVKVINTQTEEVIKEIPDEKLMDMMADFCEASGILVDERI